jgi:hypothetical protein
MVLRAPFLWHFADTLTDSCVEVKPVPTFGWLALAFAVYRIKVLVLWTSCVLAFAFARTGIELLSFWTGSWLAVYAMTGCHVE